MKILIVDDEDMIRKILTEAIGKCGFEVQTAKNGREGLEIFKEYRPELVITDIQMPEKNGLELLEEIRELSPDTIVIIITASDSQEYAIQALRLGANNFLHKPFSLKELTAHLEKYSAVLDSRSVEREIVGRIKRRELTLILDNQIDNVNRFADFLVQESSGAIAIKDRLGVHLGLVEMLTNAIEHGNLGITFEEKAQALGEGSEVWDELCRQRAGKALQEKLEVRVDFRLEPDLCQWIITDCGEGFNLNEVPDPLEDRGILEANGRGIFLTRLQFDNLEYLGRGNQVRLTKFRTDVPVPRKA